MKARILTTKGVKETVENLKAAGLEPTQNSRDCIEFSDFSFGLIFAAMRGQNNKWLCRLNEQVFDMPN